ncbi:MULTISPECIES: UbiA family prenyltransferase [Methylomonas]|uniref:4-hydroxybenzoate polyprenyltransferase n=2 Tax=Methylomonas TaxID=416 RepID=A0A126T9X1_9GAMM|nr:MULTISPECIES: UbiA family prenyltransferase [Methylomonas]AMK78594.1 4-hydroxybenzoate polyprenyltransferase [Methylomonas denitrificans]OAH96697.1 4-hydroxybenzoate polyprenyltransferase [Methylomonas methanica]TCV71733.1 4-hydroxybenzoate polyprenyltransferase [Methylomonas methanica]
MTTASTIPLVIDLDGTLTPTDTLVESIIQLCKQHPPILLKLPFWLIKGRAGFKARVANRSTLSVTNLPYRTNLVDYLRNQKKNGRQLILATAANRNIANAVAAHLGLFDTVLSSSESHNLKGTEKLIAIQKLVGSQFVYAGDSKADLPIWQAAQAAILVNTSSVVSNAVRKNTPIELEFPAANTGIRVWLRALRVHQWFKNLLLFVPLLTAFSFQEVDKLLAITLAFFAFSLTASATYIGNDLWDLESDRSHPRKRYRPFASAQIPIIKGFTLAAGLLVLGLMLAAYVSLNFFWILLLYLFVTLIYTWTLKTYVLIDVIVLSLLYTLRIIAGSVAVEVPTSSWLLAFSVFIFFSLALVKRCSELVSLQQSGKEATRGRDYRTSDLVVLWPLGVGSALSAVVVFGLFISATETQVRYANSQGLWLVAIGLIYWLARLWIKTSRGEMHDDPLVFAIRDFGSRITIIAMIMATLAAHFLVLE